MEDVKTATLGRWERLCARAGAKESPAGWHDRMLKAWQEPHRHYHNLDHLEECLLHLDEVTPLCEDAVAVEFALWFHDAVYDPKASDNEEQSAELAAKFLSGAGLGAQFIGTVKSLILATKAHDPGDVPDAAVMLDIDLSILGQPRPRYARYEEAIRLEFAWVTPAIFAEKRAAILESFLARGLIYETKWFHESFEASARDNLAWAVQRLRHPAES